MDKQSLSQWGYIICIVLILAFVIAFASPFGTYIVTSVKGVLFNFNQTASLGGGLDAPKNLKVIDEVFSFDPVDEATGYQISIAGGTPFSTTSASIDISDKLIGFGGDIKITVKAFNDTYVSPKAKYTYLIPGLYATGSNYTTLLTPWKELVADGVIHVDDGVVYTNYGVSTFGLNDGPTNASSDYLTGDLLLPHDGTITELGNIDKGLPAFTSCIYLTGIMVPDGVTSICEMAFYSCENLTNVILPNGITKIDGYAFMWCENLKSVNIPSSLTTIEEYTFAYCPFLENIKIPSSVKTIEEYAFDCCRSINKITLPDGLEKIGNGAFSSCSITEVTIPSSVTSIGSNPFSGCNLNKVSMPVANDKYRVDGSCLIEIDTKTLITGTTNSIIPTDGSVTIIGYGAFNGYTGLTSLVLPSSIEEIQDNAFDECVNLENINIPTSVKIIGKSVFKCCEKIKTITIPDGITILDDSLFDRCYALETITIPSSVTTIATFALKGTTSLTTINYNGTMSQWNAIAFGDLWDMHIGDYTVYCSDGNIAKE